MSARVDTDTLLPPEPASASTGRRFLRGLLPTLPDDVLDVVLLLASELISNAVRHGTGEVRLCVGTDDPRAVNCIRVGVSDGNPLPPRLRPEVLSEQGLPAESGRGVLLLDRLASRWGVTPEESGKQVWFELDIPH